jgi:hypothetical protein
MKKNPLVNVSGQSDDVLKKFFSTAAMLEFWLT